MPATAPGWLPSADAGSPGSVGTWVRWSYTFTPAESGATLSEAWEFLPDGIARFHEKYWAAAEAQIAERSEAALRGIAVTLAPVKAVAEAK
jgi:hypothetical protein